MPPVELLLIFGRIVYDDNFGDEVKESLGVTQSYETAILIICLYPEDKIHLEMDVGLLQSQCLIVYPPLIDIGLEQPPNDIVLNTLDGEMLIVILDQLVIPEFAKLHPSLGKLVTQVI
jgi:hypothetical protein